MSQTRLGELLAGQRKLTREQLQKALAVQASIGGRLGTNLLELGLVDEATLLKALGEQRSTKTASKEELRNVSPSVVKMVPPKLARRYHVVPLYLERKTLFIASRDLGDALVEDEIRMLTGHMVRTCIGLELRIIEALTRYYQAPSQLRYSVLLKRLSSARLASSPAERPKPVPPAPVRQPESRIPPSLLESPRRARLPETPRDPQPLYIELDAEDQALLQSEPSAEGSPAAFQPSREAAAPAPPAATPPSPAAGSAGVPPALPKAVPVPPAPAAVAEPPVLAPPSAELSLEERLDWATHELQHAEIRDEIADVLLGFCAPFFKRRMLLIHRKEHIVGWRGEGEGVLNDMVRGIDIQANEPSVFLSVSQSSSFWLGPLPPLPPNQNIVFGLGGQAPKNCVVLPVNLRAKHVCYLYGDNMDAGVAGAPIAELRRLVGKAGLAFEVYILKNKIRML